MRSPGRIPALPAGEPATTLLDSNAVVGDQEEPAEVEFEALAVSLALRQEQLLRGVVEGGGKSS
jgi:hypothetical protein